MDEARRIASNIAKLPNLAANPESIGWAGPGFQLKTSPRLCVPRCEFIRTADSPMQHMHDEQQHQ